ncbi:MAG: hypothetical protein Q4E53_05480 [Eubacteriales bacterium]|nr:hypothetical protein [Eubacteriales bacterium]
MNQYLINTRYEEAKIEEYMITKDMLELSVKFRFQLHDLTHRMKSKRSFIRKVKSLMVLKGFTQKEAILNIKDLIRYTIILDQYDRDELDLLLIVLRFSLNDKGYHVLEEKDYFLYPKHSGYNAYHLYFISPFGFVFEIQIHTKDSLSYKDRTHNTYKKSKKLPIHRKRNT